MVDFKFTPQVEILSAEDGPRRRHWSDADKIRAVEDSYRGHRQVSATARRHGICRSLLTVWRRQYRNGELTSETGPSFVPVEMAVDVETPPRQPSRDVELEIVLRNGRRLLVPSSVDPDALARLLPVLESKWTPPIPPSTAFVHCFERLDGTAGAVHCKRQGDPVG